MIKRIFAVMLLLAVLLSAVSCGSDTASFTTSELTLVVPNDFYESDTDEYDMLLTNGYVTVAVTRLSFYTAMQQGIPETYTVSQFAEAFTEKTGTSAVIYKYGDTPYYTYRHNTGSTTLFCTATFYKTPYAFFFVLFSTSASNEAEWREKFLEIADSVIFEI